MNEKDRREKREYDEAREIVMHTIDTLLKRYGVALLRRVLDTADKLVLRPKQLTQAYSNLLNAEYTQMQIDREREGDKNKGKRPLDERIEPNLPEVDA